MLITRRSALGAGLLAIGSGINPFATWLTRQAWAAGPVRVRHNAYSPAGKAMLKKYERAVNLMATRTPEGDPLSWTFQFYTHWVKGTTTKAAEINRIYPQPSANKTLAEAMWDTCQAHGDNEDEAMFLPWHRMYVLYFEDIIRQVLHDASFTLPYWNYSAAMTPAMPPEFRVASSPLFRSNRNAGPNNGNPIPKNLVSLDALQETSYGPEGAAQGFDATLDFGLHGNVHVWIGNTQGMGSVPFAAYDPVFWMHHCNIDRLWASWNRGGRKNPQGAWLNQEFTFADARGQKIVTRVGQVDNIAKLNYTYDGFEPVPTPAAAATVAPSGPARPTVLLQSGPSGAAVATPQVISLTAAPVRVPLASGLPSVAAVNMATRLQSLPANRRLLLVLDSLVAEQQPGIVYEVYFDLPASAPISPNSPNFVGTMNFFAAAPMPGMNMPAPRRTRSFDITRTGRALAAQGRLSAEPSVTISPEGAPAETARPIVGRIEVVEQ